MRSYTTITTTVSAGLLDAYANHERVAKNSRICSISGHMIAADATQCNFQRKLKIQANYSCYVQRFVLDFI